MRNNIISESYTYIIDNLDNITLAFLFMLIGFIYAVLNNISFKNDGDVHPYVMLRSRASFGSIK